ncbi:transposase, IS4 family protein [Calothrix sp. PCC 7716]|nr:transposase, IS4 family protein [Calothrix sp. PCC 7716]BDA70093.1 transposase, IS4 family protein [Calothrix sp. PCC 7716]BDA70732.1 transposase, IS4 family protein [Calothrix sp. PCC 7716]BDA72043.1 transposase, IS4 family protein [Calothrix sp. PCC 7716]BDA73159.1 transposase, IS4 family protein [Calothrix sp. PCC 7716]
MPLINFDVQKYCIPPEQLLGALETVIPASEIDKAIQITSSEESRQRILPTHVVVALIIAMSFWSRDSIVDVFKNLTHGLSSVLIPEKIRFKAPTSSSISEARQRIGCAVMTRLFEVVAKPLATISTPGAFLGGLRVMAMDGTVFDVPDTEDNARVFSYPGSRPGTYPAFPKARLVFLVEAGTRLIIDAFCCPYRIGERKGALKLLRSVSKGMLLMWDRGLHSFKMFNAAIKQGCHVLGRVPKNVKFEVVKNLPDGSYVSWIVPDGKSRKKGATRQKVRVIEYIVEENGVEKVYRLITDLMDIVTFPALLLAREYHQRWEAENTLDELKVHLNGRKIPIRSKNPREVIQEIYGWLIGHYCIRSLMFQSATVANISPLRLSFTGSLRVIKRAVPQFQQIDLKSSDINVYYSWLIWEILALEIPPPQQRSNPRVVKKTRCKFKSKKRCHRGNGTTKQQLSFKVFKTVITAST